MSTRVTKQQFRSALDVLNNVAKQDIFKFADSMDAKKPKSKPKQTDKSKMDKKPATKKKPMEKQTKKKPTTKKSTK